MRKYFFIILTSAGLTIAQQAQAICPVCTVAVGAGVGLSRWLGVDDVISGLWIGAIIVSMIFWTLDWLEKKKINFKGIHIVTTLCYYLLVVAPLGWSEVMGHPNNRLWGIDKLMLGIFLGGIAFGGGAVTYFYLKKKNNDRAHFPFEKVVLAVAPVIILSILFYFVTR